MLGSCFPLKGFFCVQNSDVDAVEHAHSSLHIFCTLHFIVKHNANEVTIL